MSDRFTYSRDQVEALLPSVWVPDFGVLAARAEQARAVRGDPALGGNLQAMVADVRKAWRASLEPFDREVLRAKHFHGLQFEVIALLAGLDGAEEAAGIEECAMDAMLRFLNGE